MIWTLKIQCVQGFYLRNECIRIVEIDSQDSLIDLHFAIQYAVDFDNDHLFDFFIGRNPRNKSFTFYEGDGWYDDFDPFKIFDGVKLSSIWPMPVKGLKLYYHFDFGDDWIFQVTKSRQKEKEPEKEVKYPRVIKKTGPNPEQYPDWVE